MKWSPSEMGDLFVDNEDYLGLIYWYDDLIQVHEEMKKK